MRGRERKEARKKDILTCTRLQNYKTNMDSFKDIHSEKIKFRRYIIIILMYEVALQLMVIINEITMMQSLQALAKISREHPAACLQAGALTAVLSNFEFYSTGVQVTKSFG